MNVNGIPVALARIVAGAAAPARAAETRTIVHTSAAARVHEAGGFDAVAGDEGADATPAALRGATLWEVLTAEERAFFADPATLGALTYRPGGRPADAAPAALGQRVDFTA